jgi:hypothetical protein
MDISGPRTTGLIGLSLVSIYLLIEFFTLAGNSAKNPVVVLSNGFFFVSANVIGLLAVRIRERNLRALFLAKQALQEEVTERKRWKTRYGKWHSTICSPSCPIADC